MARVSNGAYKNGTPAWDRRRAAFRSEMRAGEDIDAYDQIVALSPGSQRHALEYTRDFHVDVVYWPVLDPTGLGSRRRGRSGKRPDEPAHMIRSAAANSPETAPEAPTSNTGTGVTTKAIMVPTRPSSAVNR